MLIFVTAVTVALVVSFLCSIFEAVLLSISHVQIESLVRQGRRSGILLAGFKRNIDTPIAAILIVNTAAHTVGSAVAGATFADVFDERNLWLFTLIFTTAVLLFTEIIPKTIGVSHAAWLATPVAWGIRGLTIVLWPLVVLTGHISRFLRGGKIAPATSVEEIRLMAALGRSEGVFGVRTADMIVGATRLRQLTAADVMLPRREVSMLSASHSRAEALEILKSTGHSRFPFSSTPDIDQVTGVVLAKELLFWMKEHAEGPVDWPALTRELLIVPESQRLNELLKTFQESRRHMAMVVDEYGGVKGIVTLEDVLEEIVGDIRDESDRPADEIWPQADGSLHVRGSIDLRQLCARLQIDWSPDSAVVTLSGLISERLERLPAVGDRMVWQGYQLDVLAVHRRRAEVVAIRRPAEPPAVPLD